jgi:hypothetical protein
MYCQEFKDSHECCQLLLERGAAVDTTDKVTNQNCLRDTKYPIHSFLIETEKVHSFASGLLPWSCPFSDDTLGLVGECQCQEQGGEGHDSC